ncbi:MAG: hypothetical protein IKE63_00140 [Bacilli bacterium]|nr:hypothetical protein [Bacilli bacterium]
MEKILRENKYRMRDLDRKRARKEKIETIISCILFSLVFAATLIFIEFIERINF